MEKTRNYSTFVTRIVFIVCIMLAVPFTSVAQKIVSQHKVQKQETIFGIAKMYGVTMDELRDANPMMRDTSFTLKKGMTINIPEHRDSAVSAPASSYTSDIRQTVQADDPSAPITVGVMLPLHDINGDGRRMVEYYRGMLLAMRVLKAEGFNITMNAWNVAEGDDIRKTLLDTRASQCSVIFGPLYTAQVPSLANFCMMKNIPMVIPFSINANNVQTCPLIHQVYQTPADITAASITHFVSQFSDCHPVFIDCNDASSKKGEFTFGLRNVLEEKRIEYSITNLDNSSEESFRRSFSTTKRNVVVLNTGRSPELGRVFKRLDALTREMPSLKISMYGYNEWFMYARIYQDKYRRYDTYVPSFYDYDPESSAVRRIESQYQQYFNTSVQESLPRFALTGYDHLMYFVRGISRYGKAFHGTADQHCYTPVQSPLTFERLGNGGYQNRTFMLVHYK